MKDGNNMWKKFLAAAADRLMTFESLNGAFIFIPWGIGFIYCGLYDQALGYKYGMVSLGLCLIIWGVRKVTVNRVKQQARFNARVKAAMAAMPLVPPSPPPAPK